jgi:Predicted glutamine amidotransferases
MKPLIGVILRPMTSKTNRKMFGIYNKINKALKEDARVIGIVSPTLKKVKKKYKKDITETLKLLDGIVLQGGDDITALDLFITKYVYENNIATFGICLGMQTMSYFKKAKIKDIETQNNSQENEDDWDIDIDKNSRLYKLVGEPKIIDHNIDSEKYVHEVNIDKNSKLHEIVKKDKIKVNSRHKCMVINTELKVSATSPDEVVEAVEEPKKDFFIGVQWHPEDMISYDKVSKKIFEYFIEKCREKCYENGENWWNCQW